MHMEITIQEAINLIINLYMAPLGFWKDEVSEYPEVQKMVDAGLVSLEEEHGDKNVKGVF